MKKIISILFLVLFSLSGFAKESISDSLVRISREASSTIRKEVVKVNESVKDNLSDHNRKDWDTISKTCDTIVDILKNEYKTYGLKKTIQINKDLFLAIAIIIVLSLIWFKGRKKV